jgi:hypothetical protein
MFSDPGGLTGPDADAQLEGGMPHEMSGLLDEALAALFKAVRLAAGKQNAARDKYLASDWNRIVTADHEAWDRPENANHRAREALHLACAARPDEDGEPTFGDGIDVPFTFTDEEVATWFAPVVRMAFEFVRQDHMDARQIMRDMLDTRAEDGDGNKMVADMLNDWLGLSRICQEMAEFVRAAHNRALISLYVVAPDHPEQFQIAP